MNTTLMNDILIDQGIIKIQREPNDLDLFVIDFIKIIKLYTDYSLVGGYIAIILGRSRGTEDVDIYIPRIDKNILENILIELKKYKWWCLNADATDTIYEYLQDNMSVRFAKDLSPIPNIEIKFVKDTLDNLALKDSIIIQIGESSFKFSSIEMNIAFKEELLGSNKDKEDSQHLRDIFKTEISEDKIRMYKQLIKEAR